MAFLSSCAPIKVTPKVLAEDEKFCYEFLKNNMMTDGGMMTNYHKKPLSEEVATGKEVLSESQGLLLNYTADIADRVAFDKIYEFTKNHLDTGKIFAYRYNPDADKSQAYTVNAAVDDLRIIKGLYKGAEVFSDRALKKDAKNYSDRFYKSNVEDGRLYDFYDTQLYMKNSFITLCYLDMEALSMLAKEDRRYKAVCESSLEILQGGYISDEFPMFMTRYDYIKEEYETPADINMIEAVLTALNLAYVQKCPEETIDFLNNKLDDKIYASYNTDGVVKSKFESTAIYALCGILAAEIGDEEMYNKSIAHMKKFMVSKPNDSLHGAFGDNKNIYSFDNLMALTALRRGERDEDVTEN